jgi:SAM-dependent methyltransferase
MVRFAVMLVKPLYLGDSVQCPVCGKHYRKFLPYGYVKSRSNALCPNCLSLERHRLLWLYFQRKTDILASSKSFLHIAPEICFVSRLRKTHLDYKTADLESPWADFHFNIEDIPMADESFDVIMANHILEHVDNLDKALSEVYRVLKKGGCAILISPINPKREVTYEDKSITSPLEREKHFGQKDHLREFGTDYAQVIKQDCVEIIEDKFIDTLSDEEKERYALIHSPQTTIEQYVFVAKKK